MSAIVSVQSILGKFGDNSGAAWSWVAGVFVPPLSILLTATLTESTIHWHEAKADAFKFWLSFIVGGLCVVAVFSVILLEPFLGESYFELFNKTSLALALWEGFAIAAIGAVIFEGR